LLLLNHWFSVCSLPSTCRNCFAYWATDWIAVGVGEIQSNFSYPQMPSRLNYWRGTFSPTGISHTPWNEKLWVCQCCPAVDQRLCRVQYWRRILLVGFGEGVSHSKKSATQFHRHLKYPLIHLDLKRVGPVVSFTNGLSVTS
jgi:hypothetical protein